MNNNRIKQWCKQNGWREPRQLESGRWVALPPEGKIAIPLPLTAKLAVQTPQNYGSDLLGGFILILAGTVVAAIALIISPLFLPFIIQRHKQRRSMSRLETDNN